MSGITKPAPSLSNIITAAQTAHGDAAPSDLTPLDVVHEGWLLKKKRKKLQGYPRRYFILHSNGALSYSVHQGDKIRDQIFLNNAAFSSSPNNRYIHVDSGTATFHLRALTQPDYEEWMSALRKFIAMGGPLSAVEGGTRPSFNYARTVNFSIGHATKMIAVLDDMEKTLHDLSDAAQALTDAGQHSVRSKKDHTKETSKEHGFLGLWGKPKPTKSKIKEGKEGTTTGDDASAKVESPKMSEEAPIATIDGLLTSVQTLGNQHKQLVSTFNALLHLDNAASPATARAASPGLPLHVDFVSVRGPSRAGTARRTMSVGTTSDDSVQWFDADVGPEEFVLEEPEAEAEADGKSQRLATEPDSESNAEDEQGDTSISIKGSEIEKEKGPEKPLIQRRTKLPAVVTGDEMSLLTVLKKNVGKDLSQVALPVGFNEPISILQRLAEDLEYVDLIKQAVASADPVQRFCLVAAFAVSGYACTQLRATRKPFNPMLGETFEDPRFNFVAEKVCHVPPVMACHASGEGWAYDSVTQAKQKFWGRSLEIIPIGTTTLTIGGDVYSWQKPSSFMRNIVAGTKYLEHVGTMAIENKTTGAKCNIEFKESGMWGPAHNIVNATVLCPRGKVEAKLEGKWHESMARVLSKNQLEILWKANQLPPSSLDYYGFTYFTMTLNEITEDLKEQKEGGEVVHKIPITDSRFRPDQRAMEHGQMDEANEIKIKVEEQQRARRKAGKDVKPRWFTKTGEGDTDWAYKGGYWETREQGWGAQESLW